MVILGRVIIRSYYFGKCGVKFGIGLMYWVVDFGSWIQQSKQFKVFKASQVVHCIFDVVTRNSYCQVFCNAGSFSQPKWQIVENASWKMDWSDAYFPSMRDLWCTFSSVVFHWWNEIFKNIKYKLGMRQSMSYANGKRRLKNDTTP